MIVQRNNPKARRPGRAPLRHAASVAVALLLNGTLALLLASSTGRGRAQEAPLRAVPITVTPPQPEPAEPAPLQPPVDAAPVEPTPPVLPPLPQPALPRPAPALDAPAPIDIAVHPRLDVPAYAAEAASPVLAPPAPVRSPPAARPAPARLGTPSNTHGPVLLGLPDLSSYYPRRALLQGVTGQTRLRLTVDALGRVTDAHVVSSQPAGVFDHAAGRVGRVLRFRPARRAGRPVPAVVSLNLSWKVE